MRRERPAVRIRLVLLLPVVLVSFVFTGSGPAAALPACAADGYGLEIQTLPRTDDRQAEVMVTGGWMAGTERRRSCALDGTIALTLADSGGATAGAEWRVHRVLHPWGSVVHTWVWRNWCG